MFLKLKEKSGDTILVNTDRVTSVEKFMTGSFVHVAGKDQAIKVAESSDEVYQAYIDQQVEQALFGVNAAVGNMMGKLDAALAEGPPVEDEDDVV